MTQLYPLKAVKKFSEFLAQTEVTVLSILNLSFEDFNQLKTFGRSGQNIDFLPLTKAQ